MYRNMILVCHAADGHIADGDRQGIRRVLDWSESVANVELSGCESYEIVLVDGGKLELDAPGLDGNRSFHHMELFFDTSEVTPGVLTLIYELMHGGGFGLMDSVEASQFIVSQPQQVAYFPRLPEMPRLVRNSRDLGHTLGHPIP
ncbi:MAG TPA: hypothetical protein VHP83_27245 [Aggregatilineaceae bacterium]|nr:hypothetical protein [Aggregatilineaceae bacterium]